MGSTDPAARTRLNKSIAAYELLINEMATVLDPTEDEDRVAELSDIIGDGAAQAAREDRA
jgi:hypothetical protein